MQAEKVERIFVFTIVVVDIKLKLQISLLNLYDVADLWECCIDLKLFFKTICK